MLYGSNSFIPTWGFEDQLTLSKTPKFDNQVQPAAQLESSRRWPPTDISDHPKLDGYYDENGTWSLLTDIEQSAESPDPLIFHSHEIVKRLKECPRSRSDMTCDTGNPRSEELCNLFFSPSNLHAYLELYWAMWHPNWPVIHKPSFDVSSISTSLIASMSIMGACHSPHLEDRQGARHWFDRVEEMVFGECDALCIELGYTDFRNLGRIRASEVLRTVQAAYLVCLVQNYDGIQEGRRRVRHRRISTIVMVRTRSVRLVCERLQRATDAA